MPSEKLLQLNPMVARGPFIDHIPSFPRFFFGLRIIQEVLSLGVLGMLSAALVVRDGDGVVGEVVGGNVLVS